MARQATSRRLLTATALLCFAAGCSGGEGSNVTGSAVENGAANGNGADGNGASASGGANAGGTSNGHGSSNAAGSNSSTGGLTIKDVNDPDAGGSASRVGNGTPEICDNIDNDDNGIIDDVDAGGDGVCDCLHIATVGHIGPWSNGGNIFKAWLNARSPLGAVELADEQLTPEQLAPLQIVVVLHVDSTSVENKGVTAPAHHLFSDAEASAFQGWVRAGGGVMTTIGYTGNEANEVVNVNKLLASIGMGYSTSKLDLSGNIHSWEPHPVSDGISNIFTDNGVEPEAMGSVIAHGDGDRVALAVNQVDSGRVAVWGDEWVTYDSEWADVKGQQVEHFWLNLLKWLSPPATCQVPIPARVK
jgi:hypothetical protein